MKFKKYQIGDKEYQFKSNALVPLLFYEEFSIDIFKEIEEISNYISMQQKINADFKKQEESGKDVEYVDESLNIEQQEILVKLAYIFNKNAEKFEISYDEWIENLGLTEFALMQNIAVSLWIEENKTTVKAKKK